MGGKYSNMRKSRKPRMSGAGAQDKTPYIISEEGSGAVKAPVILVIYRSRETL